MKKPILKNDSRHLLILGQGQLGFFLDQAAQSYGVLSHTFPLADLNQALDFQASLKAPCSVFIESEHTPLPIIKELAEKGGQIFPNLEVLEILKNKKKQKNFILREGLATLPMLCPLKWLELNLARSSNEAAASFHSQNLPAQLDTKNALAFLNRELTWQLHYLRKNTWSKIDSEIIQAQEHPFEAKALSSNGNGAVLKLAEGGYDGKGVWVFQANDPSHFSNHASIFDEFPSLGEFFEKKFQAKSLWTRHDIFQILDLFYWEPLCPLFIEMAIQAAAHSANEFVAFPLVISEQISGICTWVLSPAFNTCLAPFKKQDLNFAALQKTAETMLTTLLKRLEYVGLLACEFFVQNDGSLLINELAPRVHNSGHYTLNSVSISQFQAHVWACLAQQAFPEIKTLHPYFGMLNLIASQESNTFDVATFQKTVNSPQKAFYWYHKTPLLKGRKMGHINFWQENLSPEDACLLLQEMHNFWREKWCAHY